MKYKSRTRSKEEMQYERDQMKRQEELCPACHRKIWDGQTTIWDFGIIYHSGCAPQRSKGSDKWHE